MGWLPTGPQELERELANMEAKQAAVWDSHSGVQVLQNITYVIGGKATTQTILCKVMVWVDNG